MRAVQVRHTSYAFHVQKVQMLRVRRRALRWSLGLNAMLVASCVAQVCCMRVNHT